MANLYYEISVTGWVDVLKRYFAANSKRSSHFLPPFFCAFFPFFGFNRFVGLRRRELIILMSTLTTPFSFHSAYPFVCSPCDRII